MSALMMMMMMMKMMITMTLSLSVVKKIMRKVPQYKDSSLEMSCCCLLIYMSRHDICLVMIFDAGNGLSVFLLFGRLVQHCMILLVLVLVLVRARFVVVVVVVVVVVFVLFLFYGRADGFYPLTIELLEISGRPVVRFYRGTIEKN